MATIIFGIAFLGLITTLFILAISVLISATIDCFKQGERVFGVMLIFVGLFVISLPIGLLVSVLRGV